MARVPASFSPALREPHYGLVAGRESLASLDSAAPNQRLAFLLRMQGDRTALFARGFGWLHDLACRRIQSGQRGQAPMTAREKSRSPPRKRQARAVVH